MINFVIGIPIGIAIGIAIGLNLGIIIGKKQKPWSELTDEEKKTSKNHNCRRNDHFNCWILSRINTVF